MAMEYFIGREQALLGDRFESLYAAPADTAARGITLNGLYPEAAAAVKNAGLPLAPSPFNPNSRLLTDPETKPGRHPYHHAGLFYVQEPSAASAAQLLEVQPGMRVLDTCAAPGGKTSQLAGALKGKGLLVANEFVSQRAEILKSNLERMGVPNAVILNEDVSRIAKVLPGFFDRVLVDAPCSGEGMFRKEPQAMAQHNEGLVEQCAALGKEILEAAAACLAPEGILVYSTCTFAPQEDEGQIAAFLERHPEFELLPTTDAFGAPGEPNRTGGLPLEWEKVRRIWPCQGGEGHFLAKLQKHGGELFPSRTEKKKKPCKPVPEWEKFCQEWFPSLRNLSVTTYQDLLLLQPEGLPDLGKLHIVRGGVVAGQLVKNRFEPSHQLYMVYGRESTNQERLTLDDPRTAAWLRGEEIEAQTARKGWCAVLVDGYPLGFGKVSGGKIKNHYPKALRNLK